MSRTFQHLPYLNLIDILNTMTTDTPETFHQPEFPEFAIETTRLRSFEDWPKIMKQRPAQMADAGFFYTQISDRVICFSCGGGLCKWEENDDPWEQHALWYSKCNYVQLLKGPECTTEIAKKFGILQITKINDNKSPSVSSEQQGDEHINGNDNNCKNGSTSDDYSDQNKNANSNDTQLCKICYINEYNTIFLPCGHVIACAKCAASQIKCPVCREPFKDIKRIFFP